MQASFDVSGMPQLLFVFNTLAPREASNLVRATVHAVSRAVADDIKAAAPVDTGNLRDAIRISRRKAQRGSARSVVTFNRRRPKNGAAQKKSAFYWKFQEYGTQSQPAQPFVGPVVQRFNRDMGSIWREHFGKKLMQKLARDALNAAP